MAVSKGLWLSSGGVSYRRLNNALPPVLLLVFSTRHESSAFTTLVGFFSLKVIWVAA